MLSLPAGRRSRPYRAASMFVATAIVITAVIFSSYLSTPRNASFETSSLPSEACTNLRDCLTGGQLQQVALLDEMDPLPVTSGKDFLFVDGTLYVQRRSDVMDHVKSALESGMPVVVFGDGQDLPRESIPGLPNVEVRRRGRESLVPVAIAASGFKVYQTDGAGERSLCGLFQVQGMTISPGLVSHAVELATRMDEEPAALPDDSGLLPTGYAWFSTWEDWRDYARIIVERRYYEVTDSLSDGSDGENTRRLLRVDVETSPGQSVWDTGWRNSGTWQYIDVNALEDDWQLTAYAPSSPLVQDRTLVARLPPAGQWTYDGGGVTMVNHSDLLEHLAGWHHGIDEGSQAAVVPYVERLGIMYTTNTDQAGTSQVEQEYHFRYAKKKWWWYSYSRSPAMVLTDWGL